MADSGGTSDIEWLRNLNNELLTENAELRSTVQNLRGEYLDAKNELNRTTSRLNKVNDVNKTLAAMYHGGKGKRIKEKGFMAMSIEAGNEDMGVKLALESLQVFINRMWEKCKRMNPTLTNWDTQKGSPCFQVLFTLRNPMPVAWPPKPLWHTWLVPAAIEVM